MEKGRNIQLRQKIQKQKKKTNQIITENIEIMRKGMYGYKGGLNY
jgi:hypothetical protein